MKKRRYLWGTLLVALLVFLYLAMAMPGKSFSGPLPPLPPEGVKLAQSLESCVRRLAVERHHHTFRFQHDGKGELEEARDWVAQQLQSTGLPVERLDYHPSVATSETYTNLVAERKGNEEIVVVGAHYDSIPPTPGADDNASGTAILLELAKLLKPGKRTLRLVAFTNEEPEFFQTEDMGSLVYARQCKARGDKVVAMISLETLGYYKTEPGTQHYPFPLGLLYPDRGDFVGFVGNLPSRGLTCQMVGNFRSQANFPSQGACLPSFIPGVGWSDHWSFWQVGYPAVMVTDTAPFRNSNYHQSSDTPETLDYERMARVTLGLQSVVQELLQ